MQHTTTYSDIEIPVTTITGQKGAAIWLFGLSGSGKSTIANQLLKELAQLSITCRILDGDLLRLTINKDLGFSIADRAENIRRAATIAQMLTDKNFVVICSFITPLEEHRHIAKNILGDKYHEVFVDCPLHICEQRDVKGLYKKARNEEIKNFTGINSAFELPQNPWLHLHTDVESEKESVSLLLKATLPVTTL